MFFSAKLLIKLDQNNLYSFLFLSFTLNYVHIF